MAMFNNPPFKNEQMIEICRVRERLMAYKLKCQPYVIPEDEETPTSQRPVYDDTIKIANDALISSIETRRDLQEHFKHHSFGKKRTTGVKKYD